MRIDPARLRGLGPFTGLDDEGRARVASQLEVHTAPAGTRLIEEGEPVGGLQFLVSGEALVTHRIGDAIRELALLGRGAFIGELSLLDGGASASATVTVTRDADVATPSTSDDERALLDDPVVGLAIREVARRRRATNRVAALGPVSVTLPDGSDVDLRPMWPDDWHLMAAGRERTSTESLHQRFFSIPKLTETTLRRLATVDFDDDFAWVALDPRGSLDHDDLLGVGRYARLPDDPDVAEIALLVGDDHQARGLGRVLLAALAVAADEHGVTHLEAVALATNRPIRRLLTTAGATWETDTDPAHVHTRWPVAGALVRLADATDLEALRHLVGRALADD